MWIRQIFVAVLCISHCTVQQVDAVVNKASFDEIPVNNVDGTNKKVEEKDSVAAESSVEANRRDAPILSDSYGVPIPPDSYGPPSLPSNPAPVYGVPDVGYQSQQPSDIPPPPVSVFATGNNLDLPSGSYGAPNVRPGIPFDTYGPPVPEKHHGPPPQIEYGPPPQLEYGPPKLPRPFISKPFKPRPIYGPPKHMIPKHPKPIYGPPKMLWKPKPNYGPPKLTYGPPAPYISGPSKNIYGPPKHSHGPPKNVYGPPKYVISSPHNHYGPPDPVPHRPPPGVPAPPTPPEIKYDGWKPIPGLVSKPPSDSYGVPQGEPHGPGDLLESNDFTPPPVGGLDNHVAIDSHSNVINYPNAGAGLSDSYGAPLNAVTGSGQTVTSSVNDHSGDIKLGLSALGADEDHLSVIKSIGYEILQKNNGQYYVNGNGGGGGGVVEYAAQSVQVQSGGEGLSNYHSGSDPFIPPVKDSYGAPPGDSYAPNGPYAAAHSYKPNGPSKFHSFKHPKKHHPFRFEGHHMHSHGGGLIPPSGVYGVPPSGHYGTPLVHGPPLNALNINPPRRPVVLREPVPHGVIQSLDSHYHPPKDAKGLVHNIHSAQSADFDASKSYIPPPVQDVASKPVVEEIPNISPDLNLPNVHAHNSFRDEPLHIHGAQASALTGYQGTGPAVDGLYIPSSPHHGISIQHQGINPFGYAGVPHDCHSYKSQALPSLSYGVPSVNSYTASLAALTTNIGGGYPAIGIPITYGTPDLQAAHSQIVNSGQSINNVALDEKENFVKSLGPGAEVIPSQSIDFHSIPMQVPNAYAVQIQQSGGGVGNENIDGQYLNNALLQSVLSAVEQTKTHDNIQQQVPSTLEAKFHVPQDLDVQHSIRSEIYDNSNSLNDTSSQRQQQKEENDDDDNNNNNNNNNSPLSMIENNEIALFFNKNMDKNTKTTSEDTSETEETQRNERQYYGFQETAQSTVSGNKPTVSN